MRKDKKCHYKDLMVLALSFAAARSIFSVMLNIVETRYILAQILFFELVIVLILTELIIVRKNIASLA